MNTFTLHVPKSSFDGLYEELLLQESLIASYDVDLLLQHIKKELGPDLLESDYSDLSGVFGSTAYGKPFTLSLRLETDCQARISKILSLFGYFISKTVNEGGTEVLTIEPLVPVNITPFLQQHNIRHAYHVTPIKNKEEILKTGLLTKESQTTYRHTGSRIYLAVPDNINTLESFVRMMAKDRGMGPDEFAILQTTLDFSQKYFIDDNATTIMGKMLKVLAFFVAQPIKKENIKSWP
jgi:hypothetical protein